jgi:hypothetical protein
MQNNSNILVKLVSGIWVPARDYQIDTYNRFKEVTNYEREVIYNNDDAGIYFKIKRNENDQTVVIRESGTTMPIADWNDVKVFIYDMNPVNWYSARNYQTWAYFDFVYCGENERYYASNGSTRKIPGTRYFDIPIQNLEADIIFRMSRNENKTIFYEKNDGARTRIRISDNEKYRSGYMAYYNRMTDMTNFLPPVVNIPVANVPIVNVPVANIQVLVLPNVNLVVEETEDENKMCVICNVNKQNIRFLPCGHTTTCSVCAQKVMNITYQNGLKCPMCRQNVSHIDSFFI